MPARPSPRRPLARAALIALVIGAYDGFFGPGTGTFLIVAFVALLGTVRCPNATADAKVVNFASNLAAVTLLPLAAWCIWQIALPMAAAQFAGGAGSALAGDQRGRAHHPRRGAGRGRRSGGEARLGPVNNPPMKVTITYCNA